MLALVARTLVGRRHAARHTSVARRAGRSAEGLSPRRGFRTREAVLLNFAELRAKASHMRDRADQQSDPGAATAYRLMAEHYEAIALLQEVDVVTPSYG